MGVSKPTTITQPPPKLEAPEIPIPMSIRHLVYGKEQNQMYKLMGMTKYQYLKTTERMRYMRLHGYDSSNLDRLFKNVDFSRDFFKVMDNDNNGVSEKDLSTVLISLGLAIDKNSVIKIMKMLAPAKFRTGSYDGTNLTSKEFTSLFNTDPLSDKLVKLIKKELHQAATEQAKQDQMALNALQAGLQQSKTLGAPLLSK